jgi:hypothetical protein
MFVAELVTFLLAATISLLVGAAIFTMTINVPSGLGRLLAPVLAALVLSPVLAAGAILEAFKA